MVLVMTVASGGKEVDDCNSNSRGGGVVVVRDGATRGRGVVVVTEW